MCWEDLVIGRRIKSRVYQTDAQIVIPANGKRIGFRLTTDDQNYADLNKSGTLGSQVYMYCQNGVRGVVDGKFTSPPDKMTIWDVGDLIYDSFVLASGGGIATLVETYLDDPPEVARKANAE